MFAEAAELLELAAAKSWLEALNVSEEEELHAVESVGSHCLGKRAAAKATDRGLESGRSAVLGNYRFL
jgi:hypothetical protein